MFVSGYFFAQAQADNAKRVEKGKASARDEMAGRAIDDPVVLDYLAERFDKQLQMGIDWLQSGASVVVRYEGLVDDPVAELRRATDQLQPVSDEQIRRAVKSCQADALLSARKGLRRRIRAATSGDWRNHLAPAHLAIFRERHAARIRALGYEVR
jgi:hypothetical protein